MASAAAQPSDPRTFVTAPAADRLSCGIAVAQPRQLAEQVACGLPTVVRILGQARRHQTLRAQVRRAVAAWRAGRLEREDRRDQVRLRLGGEGARAGEHFVEHRAEGEQIGARIGFLASHLLGRHVRERADESRLPRVSGSSVSPETGGSPVVTGARRRASPKSSSFTPDFVSMMLAGLRSRWTMPSACAAASASAISMAQLQGLLDRQRPAPQPRGQRFALEQLHHEEPQLAARRPCAEPTSYSVQMCGCVTFEMTPRLALEPLTAARVARQIGRQHFDGDRAIETRVAGAIDLAHAARAEQAEDLERAEPAAGREARRAAIGDALRADRRSLRNPSASACAASSDSTSRRIARRRRSAARRNALRSSGGRSSAS